MAANSSLPPPATALAKGGQNPPPARIRGRKPLTIVMVVEMMWPEDAMTTRVIAFASPVDAISSFCNAVRMISAAFIDTPI